MNSNEEFLELHKKATNLAFQELEQELLAENNFSALQKLKEKKEEMGIVTIKSIPDKPKTLGGFLLD